MSKVDLDPITSGYNLSKINECDVQDTKWIKNY